MAKITYHVTPANPRNPDHNGITVTLKAPPLESGAQHTLVVYVGKGVKPSIWQGPVPLTLDEVAYVTRMFWIADRLVHAGSREEVMAGLEVFDRIGAGEARGLRLEAEFTV